MPSDTNWVTLLATNDRRGGVAAPARKPPTELIWKATLGDAVRSSPVLRDGVLYVGCRDGRLYAFDVSNGRERWRYQAAAAIHSTPSISGNLVLVGADDGTVSAIDRTSGVRRWQVPVARSTAVISPPVLPK
jgi:serine/threonine-protein kinase